MTYEEKHNLPAPIGNDGFAAAAASADRHLLKGDLAKFVDGVWTINKQPVSKGTQFVPVKLIIMWVKWDSEKPIDYAFPGDNGLLPARESLGDNDESEWPDGLNGRRDPWQNTRYIHLINTKTAEWITATNNTVGMRLCYEALGQAVATMRAAHPQALPVVELSSTPMKTQHGEKLRPHLRIVGWKQGGSPEEPSKQIEPPRPRSGFEPASDVAMDDEIPF